MVSFTSAPIIIFSLLYNIPKFFEVRTRCSITVASINGSNLAHWVSSLCKTVTLMTSLSMQVSDKYIWDKSEVRSEKNYMTYITANCIVMGLLPMVLLSILNWLIFRAISRAHALHASLMSGNAHRRDSTMATVLTAIVIVFVVCHLPKAALNIYEVCTVSLALEMNSDRKMDDISLRRPSSCPPHSQWMRIQTSTFSWTSSPTSATSSS